MLGSIPAMMLTKNVHTKLVYSSFIGFFFLHFIMNLFCLLTQALTDVVGLSKDKVDIIWEAAENILVVSLIGLTFANDQLCISCLLTLPW